ncbi:hypothetical protein, partial [Hymenobacter psychrophilus]|uniref:hypothetical protein n=1 Tax=Hymenobacter psychrophilus TaxID=651662 RepID=UPI001C31B6F4
LFFSPLNNSQKGVNTIKMFRLMNGRQAQLRGSAVIKHMWEKGILPDYDPARKIAINSSYIM